MSLNLDEKKAVVAEVSAQIAKVETIVVAQYHGLDADALTRLRVQARKGDVYLRVLKNTLVRRSVAGTVFEPLAEQMVGPLIYAMSADAVGAAKLLHTFSKDNAKLVVTAGCYAGQMLDAKGVAALATIPSREELLARLLGVMQAPLIGFVGGLAALAKKQEADA